MTEHPLDRRLGLVGSESRAEERLDVVWAYYEEVTGDRLSRPPIEAQRLKVMQWLRSRIVAGNWPLLTAKWPVRRGVVHQTLVEKSSALSKLHCQGCEVLVRDDGSTPLSMSFALDVEPWSAQSTADRVKIRAKVTSLMRKKNILEPSTERICISIISLVRQRSEVKDVDNLVKGLLDSFEGVLYVNDRQIQCLTTRRVEYSGPSGAYFVSVHAVRCWQDDVIIDDGVPPIIV